MSDARSVAVGSEDKQLRQNFCRAVLKLRLAKDKGYAHIPEEPDVSYNNILRSLDYVLKYRFGDAKLLCTDVSPKTLR
jgi:hypothetical protein